jgi:hypothetical protein
MSLHVAIQHRLHKSRSRSAFAGLLMALITVLDVVLAPGRKVCEFNEARRKFNELDGKAPSMSIADLDIEIARLRGEYAAVGLRALQSVAYNQNVLANGRGDAAISMTRWERLVAALA